ncbi:hypothetical protein RCH14_004493 [Massilia sp. MP_M2]
MTQVLTATSLCKDIMNPTDDAVTKTGTESAAEGSTSSLDNSVILLEGFQLAAFQKRLDSLNKKAKAFGLEPIRILASEEVEYMRLRQFEGRDNERMVVSLVPWKPANDPLDDEPPVILTKVRIEYPIVKLGQWQVVGKLEAIEGGNLTFSVTQDEEDRAVVRDSAEHPIQCDHCKTKRKRKDGFILRDENNDKYMQVGGNCLEDFTGIDPGAALFLARMHTMFNMASDELDEFASSGRVNAVETDRYLAAVSFLTSHYGFVSASKARETGMTATYEDARQLGHMLQQSPKLMAMYVDERERHMEIASTVREWMANKPADNDFDRNAKLLLARDAISTDRKHLAFAAATVATYNRHVGKQAEAKQPSEHVGQKGEKMERILRIDRIIDINTAFGVSRLVMMTDEAGNKFKWKTGACPYDISKGEGKSMVAAFKVKEHDDYKGVAQTAVTHLKVKDWLEPEATVEQSASPAAPLVAAPKPVAEPQRHWAPPRNDYRFTIYQHAVGCEHDFTRPVLESHTLNVETLGMVANSMKIDGVSQQGTAEHVWYVSNAEARTKKDDGELVSFSLHIHDVDGNEPNQDDYDRLTKLLQPKPELIESLDSGPAA